MNQCDIPGAIPHAQKFLKEIVMWQHHPFHKNNNHQRLRVIEIEGIMELMLPNVY